MGLKVAVSLSIEIAGITGMGKSYLIYGASQIEILPEAHSPSTSNDRVVIRIQEINESARGRCIRTTLHKAKHAVRHISYQLFLADRRWIIERHGKSCFEVLQRGCRSSLKGLQCGNEDLRLPHG